MKNYEEFLSCQIYENERFFTLKQFALDFPFCFLLSIKSFFTTKTRYI